MRRPMKVLSPLLFLVLPFAGCSSHSVVVPDAQADGGVLDSGVPDDGAVDATAASKFIRSIDTMKISRDTETHPIAAAQVALCVDAIAKMNVTHITVATNWDYPAYMKVWIDAIRAAHKSVWFRGHPNAWEAKTGTPMTPAEYLAAITTFVKANPTFFASGDIFDSCSEPENGTYWPTKYGSSWSSPGSAEFNQFLRDGTDVADQAITSVGISGVTTTIRSTNSWWPAHQFEPATIARLGRVTIDSYPEGTTTDPATATAARINELQAIEAVVHVPIVIGEMGYAAAMNVGDSVQDAVLGSEFSALEALPFLDGVNYWVGPGDVNAGNYTWLLTTQSGYTGWTPRLAAARLTQFFADEAAK